MDYQAALLVAVKDGNLDEVQRLVDAGADLQLAEPLASASLNGQLDVVQFILDHGTDVNQADKDGWTALFHASLSNQTSIVQLLLQRGAAIDQQDKNGVTALHVAAMSGLAEVVRLLLDAGADRTLKDKRGTAGTNALLARKPAMANLIRDYVPASPTRSNASTTPRASPVAFGDSPPVTRHMEEIASLRAQLQATRDELTAAREQHVIMRQQLDAAHAVHAREMNVLQMTHRAVTAAAKADTTASMRRETSLLESAIGCMTDLNTRRDSSARL